jgi:hypothetical protein
MFCSGFEKLLNQIDILFKLNFFKLKFYLFDIVFELHNL